MRHAVIMAGGAGVRLWPLSRRERPKQILRLFDGTSLLRQCYERIAAMFPPEQINLITTRSHVPIISAEIPELPAANVLGEPTGRDTANAVGLACAVLARRDPDAVIGIFPADHVVTPLDCFRGAVEEAFASAEQDPKALVTIGVRPTRPDINYGYILRGERRGTNLYEVGKFVEKPNVAKATKYLASGEYYWNSGLFVWRASTILQELQKHLPQTFEAINEIAASWHTEERSAKLERLYPGLLKISIDFAVMEKAQHVLVVEMPCHWVDIGSWPAIESVIHGDADGNVSTTRHVVHLGSRGNIVVSEEKHLIATIGVEDLVIVHAPDATFICKRRDAAGIKELVNNISAIYGEEYL